MLVVAASLIQVKCPLKLPTSTAGTPLSRYEYIRIHKRYLPPAAVTELVPRRFVCKHYHL
jgi:hypothetical protein